MNLRSIYFCINLGFLVITNVWGQENSSLENTAAEDVNSENKAPLTVDSEQPVVAQKEVHESQEPALSNAAQPAAAKDAVDTEGTVKPLIDQEGLDTIDQEGGNWLLKRKALEDTVDLIEKINKLFIDILKARMDFLVRRNKAERDSEIFMNDIGFQLGDLSQLLNSLVEKMEHERAQVGDLTEEEREALDQVEKRIADLKQLQADVKSIEDLDAAVDDVVMQMESEINKSNTYQSQAWKNFQLIKKILNDEKATELYLQTEGLYKNLQDIQKYLNETLQSYFNNTLSKQKLQMDAVKQTIEQLKQAGLNLQHEVDGFAQETEAIERDMALAKEQEEKSSKKASAAKQSSGWFDYIKVIWEYPIEKVITMWDYIIGFFVSSPKPTPKK